MNHDYTRAANQCSVNDALQIGGKAAHLAALEELGVYVPPWAVITTAAFQEVIQSDPQLQETIDSLAESGDHWNSRCEEIRARLLYCRLPESLENEIVDAARFLLDDGSFAAVRSSAVDEDSARTSFAGLHDSLLFVKGREGLFNGIRQVWASLFNERAISYRLEHAIPIDSLSIAVLLQKMIDPSTSGVAFTVNPATHNPFEVVISSLYGAGEGLVSAGLPADTFRLNKDGTVIGSDIASKESGLFLDVQTGSGLREVAIPEEQQGQPSLSEQQLQEVLSAAIRIETRFRRPQDIEFCLDAAGTLFILQTRAVTTALEYGPAAGNRIVWDNSNIIESYSGVTSPMTFSFIRRAYTIVYHCFAEVMGVSPTVVRENQTTFENMLGLFRGQVYYNLHNWYRLVSLFPGFSFNKQFMESMMGLSRPEDPGEDEQPKKDSGMMRRYGKELPALLGLFFRTSWNFFRIRSIVSSFEEHFAANYRRWSSMQFEQMSPPQLMKLYREMEDKLLWNWKAPIINDFFVMIFYGTLRKLCERWCEDSNGSLQNDLLCGEGGIESTEPTKMLMRLAATAKQQPKLAELISTTPLEEIPTALAADTEFSEFFDQYCDYLERYGFRCMNELKLEEYSLRDKPEFIFQVLRNYLTQADDSHFNVSALEAREKDIRQEAEQRAFTALQKHRSLLPRTLLFRWVLQNARLGVKNRENMRFARTKIYGIVRELLRALGKQFTDAGIIDESEDIFYLTIDEVWDFVKGTAVSTKLADIAIIRKDEYHSYREDEAAMPDDHFETFGIAYHRNLFRDFRAQVHRPAEGGGLSGTGCCPGIVEGEVKVIRSPSDDARLNGEILVAGRTDPGWVPLYPSVSGLLIERGSILSHSAIVAREMGLPTIVGIPNLLETLSTGDRVRMDGAAGTVEELQD